MIPAARKRSFSRHLAAVFSLAIALAATPASAATDYTDLWWNPSESGWGVNFIQADDFIFSTFFIYGPSGQPTWYTGQLALDANNNWIGPLYMTSGTYFGSPWNPGQSGIRQVGSVSFVPTTEASGTLSYSVDGVIVSKQVVRQTLKTIPLGGSSLGSVYTVVSGCINPAQNGTFSRFANIGVVQTITGNLTLDFTVQGGATCTFNGNANQFGQVYQIPSATYTCGNAGPLLVSGLKATAQGIEGQWQGPLGAGCVESGSFTGTLQ
jgi:hypothetical protein